MDSKFYVKEKNVCATGESGGGFGLKVIRKSTFKKNKEKIKRKLLNIMVPNFMYTNS